VKFNQPYGIAAAGNGFLVVADYGNNRVKVVDAAGNEVPYLLIAPPERTPVWKSSAILPVASTKTSSGFEADLGTTADVDRVEITGVAAPFLKRLRLEGGGDRQHWTVLAAEATVFDLPEEKLENLEVTFAHGEYRYLRVTWDDRNSARVQSVGTARARVYDSGAAPPPVDIAVAYRVLASERGRSRYRLTLPGPHLPIAAIELQVSNQNVDRAASVSEPRLSGNTVAPAPLGSSTLRRAERDGAVAAGHPGQLLRAHDGFPGGAIELAPTTAFCDDQDHAITRASSRSRRTSSLAASAGEPEISCVFLPFSGT
jgi:hypothetical protein